MMRKTIRVLFLKEGDSWIAQCLEYDIAAQGPSIKRAREAFIEVLTGQISLDLNRNREPFAGKKEAPLWYWQQLAEAQRLEPINLEGKRDFPATAIYRTAEAWVAQAKAPVPVPAARYTTFKQFRDHLVSIGCIHGELKNVVSAMPLIFFENPIPGRAIPPNIVIQKHADDDEMTPTVIRSYCDQLEIDKAEFGFHHNP